VDWFPSIEVSSVDLIETYVGMALASGYPYWCPEGACPERASIAAAGFCAGDYGALWQGKTSALLQIFLDELQLRAKRLA